MHRYALSGGIISATNISGPTRPFLLRFGFNDSYAALHVFPGFSLSLAAPRWPPILS